MAVRIDQSSECLIDVEKPKSTSRSRQKHVKDFYFKESKPSRSGRLIRGKPLLNLSSVTSMTDIGAPNATTNSPTASLPTVSDTFTVSSIFHHHPSTGQLEPRVIRRTRLADLSATVLKKAAKLSDALKSHLYEADRHIHSGNHSQAIPSLEEAIIAAKDNVRLQSVLWRLLGNVHLSLSHYRKSSVCHMHQLAFCRELDDFTGMTMAECNLGIAYMKQGLLKLAERCFLQYLENSKILQDDLSIAYACSNLGVLAKCMAINEYSKADGSNRAEKLKNKKVNLKFKDLVCKAIYYFEQHLEIVERYCDL